MQLYRVDIYQTLKDAISEAELGTSPEGELAARVRLVSQTGADLSELLVSHDRQKLHRAFANLVKNALEHDPGEVVVTVEVGSQDLSFAVHNGGVPIPHERLETIFEKYNTTKRNEKGTGLGTTIAKLFVEAHGGTVEAASTEADGTTFTVTIPWEGQQTGQVEQADR